MVAVQRALNWAAVRMGLITENPIRGIEKPKAGRRELVITAGQFHDIVSVIKDTEFRDLLTLRWETAAG